MQKKSNQDYQKQLEDIIKKLNRPYWDERDFFWEIFFDVIIEVYAGNLDFSTQRKNKGGKTYMKCKRDYNEILLICLVIQKWLYNSSNKWDLSNKDLIMIRWLSLVFEFDDYKRIYNSRQKKYSNLATPPRDFFMPRAIKSEYEKQYMQNLDNEHFLRLWSKYLVWNDFSTYIQPFTFDHYKNCIDFMLNQCDKNKFTKRTLLKIQQWIKAFLRNIKIDNNSLSHARTERAYNWNDSFDAVFYSEQVRESYKWTWDRFCEHYPKEIENKFREVIWKRIK